MTSDAEASLVRFAAHKLEALGADKLLRRLHPTQRGGDAGATRGGAALISFCDNDYLGLSQHPDVKSAAARAAMDYGAGAGASRLITGDCPLYARLEGDLAQMKGCEAALVFGSGYLANISTIPVLAGAGDAVFLDERAHACMFAGARLSGAAVESFAHNDADDLRRRLAGSNAARKLVLTETVFSMDGDRAPLSAIGEACAEADAWLMTDDAHGFGVVALDNPAPVQMGTLSKAVGAYGGYVCGPRAFIELLINRARGLIYTTGLPPPVLAAAIEALRLMRDEPERAARAMSNAALFSTRIGLGAPQSAVVPLILADAERALQASAALEREGLLVTAIRPPTVAVGTARLRFSFSAAHAPEDVARLADAVTRCVLAETSS